MSQTNPTAIVVSGLPFRLIHEKQLELDPTQKSFLLIQPGQQVGGRRFDTILVTRDAAAEMVSCEKAFNWFRETMECRLSRDGKIIRI